MTSQPVSKAIKMHILLNISHSKRNQAMKFDQVIEYNKKYFSSKFMHKVRRGRLVPDLFLFFKKALYQVKASGLQVSFNIFQYFQLGIQ